MVKKNNEESINEPIEIIETKAEVSVEPIEEINPEVRYPSMEFLSLSEDADSAVGVGTDLTLLSDGKHEVYFQVAGKAIKSDVNIRRSLDKINVTFELNNKTYSSVLHPDGRIYSSVVIKREAPFPPYEIQEQGMWRFVRQQ